MRIIVAVSIILCIAALLFATPLLAEETQGRFEELTLTISSSPTPTLPMQALPLTVTLSNKKDYPVLGHDYLWGPALVLYVARDKEEFRRTDAYDEPDSLVVLQSAQIPPGHSNSCRKVLWYQWGGEKEKWRIMFPAPGVYRVKATLSDADFKGVISSNVLIVKVDTPAGADSAAWRFLRKNLEDNPGSLFWHVPGNPDKRAEGVAILEEFTHRFSDSSYAPYAWYALGAGSFAEPYYDDAIRAFEQCIKWKDFILRKEALRSLTSICLRHGDIRKARHYLDMLTKEYPDSGKEIRQQVEAAEKAERSGVP